MEFQVGHVDMNFSHARTAASHILFVKRDEYVLEYSYVATYLSKKKGWFVWTMQMNIPLNSRSVIMKLIFEINFANGVI